MQLLLDCPFDVWRLELLHGVLAEPGEQSLADRRLVQYPCGQLQHLDRCCGLDRVAVARIPVQVEALRPEHGPVLHL